MSAKGHKFTATVTQGKFDHTIVIHATGCQHIAPHATNTCGSGDTVEEAVEWALIVVDQDNEYPGWKVRMSPCAKKVSEGVTA